MVSGFSMRTSLESLLHNHGVVDPEAITKEIASNEY
jgi:hypothetical protein